MIFENVTLVKHIKLLFRKIKFKNICNLMTVLVKLKQLTHRIINRPEPKRENALTRHD